MYTRNSLKTKLIDKRIDRINLLAHRIQQHTVTTRHDMNGNTWEAGTGSHVQEILRIKRKTTRQCNRIDKM